MIRIPAFAKINLALELLGPRPDGYTEIRTVFQTLDLADLLVLESAPAGVVEVRCEAPGVPGDESNLAGRAARSLMEALGVRDAGVRITITKNVPAGSGLGGGSSDAASTLVGLCRMWDLRPPVDALVGVARGLGSDVPFFLHGGTALGLGRGDEIWPLPDVGPWDVLLAIPPFAIPTALAYETARTLLTPRNGAHTIWRFAWSQPCTGAGRADFSWVVNDLQPAARHLQPALPSGRTLHEALLSSLRGAGAAAAAMTGSGSAVYGLFPAGGIDRARSAIGAEFPDVVTIPARTQDGSAYRAALGIEPGCWGVDKR